MFDVAIIGAGISGCAIAYKLSKFKLKIALLDKENDVCMGATRANSAIIHAGFDPEPGTLTAKLNSLGNPQCKEICKKLDVEYREIGSLVTSFSDEETKVLKKLLKNAEQNGIPGVEILSGEKAREKEPNLSNDIKAALWAPSAAITNPWQFGLAMAEVAVQNGTKVFLGFEVNSIEKKSESFCIKSKRGEINARFVINASGAYADKVSSLVCEPDYKIIPTAGEYYLLDKSEGKTVSSVIFPCPSAKGKGVLIAPTVHGNLIVGPNACVTDSPDATQSTAPILPMIDGIVMITSISVHPPLIFSIYSSRPT